MDLIMHDAPEFPEGTEWINTRFKVSLKNLRGNVVVLDFWTYCCINCIHLVPVFSEIEKKYSRMPVIILGIHSPKFDNEKKPANVIEAVSRYGIEHPVALDRDMRIWRAFGVSAWPTVVIIGPTGRVEFKAAGEISVAQLELLIQDVIDKYRRNGLISRFRPRIKTSKPRNFSALSYPGKMSFSDDGSMFALSDSNHNRIIIADSEKGTILNSIGGMKPGLSDGNFRESSFSRPQGVLWHSNKVYVADTGNHALREIDLDQKKVRTLAGTGSEGFLIDYGIEYDADGTALNSPWDVAAYRDYIFIAMAGLHQIWRYSMKNKTISVFAGSGREDITDGDLEGADFAQPSGLWLSGNKLHVADSETSSIRSISIKDRHVSTIAGEGLFRFGDAAGRLSETKLQHPIGLCSSGTTIYVADTYNSAIKSIDVKTGISSYVISGNKKSMCRFGDPECDTLGLFEPNDVKVNGSNLYIVDTNNHLVRRLSLKDRLLKTLDVG